MGAGGGDERCRPDGGARVRRVFVVSLLGAVAALAGFAAPAQAATCDDYSTQAEAQLAAATRDGDGDGRFCEELPCPCLGPGGGTQPGPAPAECSRPKRLVRLRFDAGEYPRVRRHFRAAVRRGWPKILVVNRRGADARRDRLLRDVPTRDGFDRDEYPPAVGRGRGSRKLTRGRDPRGWKADVRYVPSGENRSHGASLGGQLRPFCDGVRFRYVFR